MITKLQSTFIYVALNRKSIKKSFGGDETAIICFWNCDLSFEILFAVAQVVYALLSAEVLWPC